MLASIEGPAEALTGGTYQCTFSVTLKRGTLKLDGTVQGENFENFTLPIVGGSGKYTGATGTFRTKQLGDNKFKVTLKVTMP